MTIIQNPTQFKIPLWFLNRQRDIVDGKNLQILSNGVDSKLRDDLERLKKIRAHRGLRHFWGLRVRGQHTKTTGERGFAFVSGRNTHLVNFTIRSAREDGGCVKEAWLKASVFILEVRIRGRSLRYYCAMCFLFFNLCICIHDRMQLHDALSHTHLNITATQLDIFLKNG